MKSEKFFGFANYEFEVKIKKFKMTGKKAKNCLILMTCYSGVFRDVDYESASDFQNSK